jgi:hypothetical protein
MKYYHVRNPFTGAFAWLFILTDPIDALVRQTA